MTFDTLSAAGAEVIKRYRLAFVLDESSVLPVQAASAIGSDGVVKSALVEVDYTQRMEPADILAALRALA